jgi:hypothetical protein
MPFFLKNQDRCGVGLGDLRRVNQIPQVEVGGVSTAKEIDQIAGGEQQLPIDRYGGDRERRR